MKYQQACKYLKPVLKLKLRTIKQVQHERQARLQHPLLQERVLDRPVQQLLMDLEDGSQAFCLALHSNTALPPSRNSMAVKPRVTAEPCPRMTNM